MAQTCRHSKNVLLSKLNFFLFFTYKDISVVFLFVLKLLRTGQHLYFLLPQRVFWLAVSGWVPRNVGCVGAPMDSWCQGAEIRQLLQIHGWAFAVAGLTWEKHHVRSWEIYCTLGPSALAPMKWMCKQKLPFSRTSQKKTLPGHCTLQQCPAFSCLC